MPQARQRAALLPACLTGVQERFRRKLCGSSACWARGWGLDSPTVCWMLPEYGDEVRRGRWGMPPAPIICSCPFLSIRAPNSARLMPMAHACRTLEELNALDTPLEPVLATHHRHLLIAALAAQLTRATPPQGACNREHAGDGGWRALPGAWHHRESNGGSGGSAAQPTAAPSASPAASARQPEVPAQWMRKHADA